jgi:hypothetical protein
MLTISDSNIGEQRVDCQSVQDTTNFAHGTWPGWFVVHCHQAQNASA